MIDPQAVEPLELARCYCPGVPHDKDTVQIRTGYGWGDMKHVRKAGLANPMMTWDEEMADLAMLSVAIASWSFVDDEGKEIPVGAATIRLLPIEVGEAVLEKANEHFTTSQKQAELPNASSGRSQPSSRARAAASKTRAKR